MSRIEEFEQSRPWLFSIAYRILGSVTGAEDAVHRTWLHYEAAPATPAPDRAFLSQAVTRISLGLLRSAAARPDGPRLPRPRRPEPPATDPDQDPRRPPAPAGPPPRDAVSRLERLPPLERAVLVLREAFGCDLPRIASALGRPEAACRRLAAAASGPDGPDGQPWPRHIAGAEHVARVLAAIVPALIAIGVTMERRQVDHRPGAVFRDRDGTVLGALTLHILDGRIHTIHWVTDPDGPGPPPPTPPRPPRP